MSSTTLRRFHLTARITEEARLREVHQQKKVQAELQQTEKRLSIQKESFNQVKERLLRTNQRCDPTSEISALMHGLQSLKKISRQVSNTKTEVGKLQETFSSTVRKIALLKKKEEFLHNRSTTLQVKHAHQRETHYFEEILEIGIAKRTTALSKGENGVTSVIPKGALHGNDALKKESEVNEFKENEEAQRLEQAESLGRANEGNISEGIASEGMASLSPVYSSSFISSPSSLTNDTATHKSTISAGDNSFKVLEAISQWELSTLGDEAKFKYRCRDNEEIDIVVQRKSELELHLSVTCEDQHKRHHIMEESSLVERDLQSHGFIKTVVSVKG